MEDQTQTGIRIVAIPGSVRPGNFTGKALALVLDEFITGKGIPTLLVDPANLQLPLPGLPPANPEALEEFRDNVAGATGIVLATPEYHGSFSSVMKLVIDNLGFPSALAGKPVALLGVAAGQIGAIKATEHLRSVCSHVGALVLPGTVSIANVRQVFDDKGNCRDARIEKRIRGVATNLLDYIHGYICPKVALEQMVREQETSASRRQGRSAS